MNTKLHIDLRQGIIDVEGNNDFVLKVYEDFREQLIAAQNSSNEESSAAAEDLPENQTVQNVSEKNNSKNKRRPKRVFSSGNDATSGIKPPSVTNYQPSLDKKLDASKLSEFLSAFEPKSNPEYILIFVKFIIDTLGAENCTMNQVYSCFSATKTKFPKAFGQSFIDTRGNSYGYIDFKGPDDITITMIGQNHFNHGLKKKPVNG